jgi:hypothetical protein
MNARSRERCCKFSTTGKSRLELSSPSIKNISLYRNSDLRYQCRRPAPNSRDVSRSSRYVGCRMRWTLRRQRDASCADENAAAYGEVVWSWRRDPGATSAGLFPPATGARKAASPGRASISRKTIARGKPGCLGCTCQTRVLCCAVFCTRRCGRSRRPAFPAPSVRERANDFAKLRRNRAVRMRAHVFPRHCEPPGRREAPPDDRLREAIHASACSAVDCFVAEPVIGRAFARPVGSSQ